MRGFDDVRIKRSVLEQCYGTQECTPLVEKSLLGVAKSDQNYD